MFHPDVESFYGYSAQFAVHFQEMDIARMLAELKAEREAIEQAIMVLERVASGRGKRRGRPPKWITAMKQRGRPEGSKKKQSES